MFKDDINVGAYNMTLLNQHIIKENDFDFPPI